MDNILEQYYCKIVDHDQNRIIGICENLICTQAQRRVCFECLKLHAKNDPQFDLSKIMVQQRLQTILNEFKQQNENVINQIILSSQVQLHILIIEMIEFLKLWQYKFCYLKEILFKLNIFNQQVFKKISVEDYLFNDSNNQGIFKYLKTMEDQIAELDNQHKNYLINLLNIKQLDKNMNMQINYHMGTFEKLLQDLLQNLSKCQNLQFKQIIQKIIKQSPQQDNPHVDFWEYILKLGFDLKTQNLHEQFKNLKNLNKLEMYQDLYLQAYALHYSDAQLTKIQEQLTLINQSVELNNKYSKSRQLQIIIVEHKMIIEIKIRDEKEFLIIEMANEYIQKGLSQYKNNQYLEAINLFDKAIQLNPRLQEAYFLKGVSFQKLKKHEEAIQMFVKAISIIHNYIHALQQKDVSGASQFTIGKNQKLDEILGLQENMMDLQFKVQEQNVAIECIQYQVKELFKLNFENQCHLEQKIMKLRKIIENLINKEQDKENSLLRFFQEENIQDQVKVNGQQPQLYQREHFEDSIQEEDIIKTIDICFLIDTTESMLKNQNFILQAVKELNENFKRQSNQVINYAVVTYNDYEQNNQQKRQAQIDFDEEINNILQFIYNLKFYGGNDFPHDLQNGFNQALQLKWQSKKKIIMVFTNAPCHSQQYYQGANNNYLVQDMVNQLDQIIEQKINLMCICFENEHNKTILLYEEFKKYLFSKDYYNIQQYVVDANYSNRLFILKFLKDLGQNINQPQKSLIFEKMPNNFVLLIFEMFICDLNIQKLQQYFDNNHQQQQLVISSEFYTFVKYGQFDFCEREDQPFYQDSTKKMFQMKYLRKNGYEDLYYIITSIDGPFKSKLDAASFINSHLIAKVLFKQFKQQLDDFENINFNFSNYILLKEKNKNYNDQEEHYFIAQRFHENDLFQKFNDSEGNITSWEDSDQNEFIQSFSFFTYYESRGQFLICDLQIHKDILLHPRINTHSGQYGKEDNGKDAIRNFLYQFRNFKKQYKYLDYLNIKYN